MTKRKQTDDLCPVRMKKPRQKQSSVNDDVDSKILIAIDFGTTFSGCAWVHTSQPTKRNTIVQWPNAISEGLEGISRPKVPTELQYNGDNVLWGFKIATSVVQRHKWFKLELDPSQARDLFSLANKFPDQQALPSGNGKSPERMATDFLICLRKHIEQVLPHKVPASALASTSLCYCLTMPAVWSPTAQAKTLAAAEAAGLNENADLVMITEPEAAAIYALDSLNPHDLQVGTTFVLCDAGGGTVDLISYKVLALEPILKVKEAATGTGSLCGSSFINRLFEAFLEKKLNNDEKWDKEVLQEAMVNFEVFIKPSYQGHPTEIYHVPVSGLADNPSLNVRRGKLTVTGAELHGIFKPVIDEILTLVKGQIRATKPDVPKAVLLVGGFGQSSYLRECIRAEVSSSGIQVMQSINGWTAVVEGALMKVLAHHSPSSARIDISERRARKHYGIYVKVDFHKVEHDMSRRYWSEFHGTYKIGVMQWFIQKGHPVEEHKPVQLKYHQRYPVVIGRPQRMETQIYYCVDQADMGAPLYRGDNVKKLVSVTADLSSIPLSAFPKVIGKDGKRYYGIEYQIDITYYSVFTKYELIYQGKNYGPVHAEHV